MEKGKNRSLGDLSSIIGNVSKKHKVEINSELKDIQVNAKQDSDIELQKTAEFKIKEIQGIKIQSRVRKVPESFKIKPYLKKVVEEIVKESRNNGEKVTKGEVYNLLLAIGLKELGK